jgi:hypothetical protein
MRRFFLLLAMIPVWLISISAKSQAGSISSSSLEIQAETSVTANVAFEKLNSKSQTYQLQELASLEVFQLAAEPELNLPLEKDPNLSNTTDLPVSDITQRLNFTVFPVGLNVGGRNTIASVLVRGKEDDSQAIDLKNWLIPYDAVVEALKLNVTSLPDGQLEVRSPGLVTRINPKQLTKDPEIGLAFSIQELQDLFGVKAEFNINDYAIALDVPWLNQKDEINQLTDRSINLEGLPTFEPDAINLAAIEQRVNITGSANNSPNAQGEFQAVGSAFGGSWFLRTNQPTLLESSSWRISEAEYLRQSDKEDYFVGSHPTFWQNQVSKGDFWGITYVRRQGFTPLQTVGAGFTDPRQRLQAGQIGRTISGEAEPGTLVQLVESFGDRVVAEVLVDSSGIYRFTNVTSNNQSLSSNYRVFLYPQGRLTAPPEIRSASYTSTPGQIPSGTSALAISGGLERRVDSQTGLLGEFSDFKGGIAQRWGLSSELTVGVGGVYDESLQGLAEVFYRPTNFPLQVSVSSLIGDRLDTIADIRFDPSPKFNASFSSDRFSSRFDVNWNVTNGLALFANTDSRFGTSGGVQFNFSGKNYFTFARLSLDTNNNFRWNWLQRLGRLEMNLLGNESGTFSELTYHLSANSLSNSGHSLILNYETRNQNRNDNLLTVGWHYISPERALDGNYLWEAKLGYGDGSQGSGVIGSLSTTILPGVMLRARYQDVSVTSGESSFNIDLVSSLNFQRGITPGDRRTNYFRTQGGLLIQPFLDRNGNGKRDRNEEFYTEDSNALIAINHRELKFLQSDVQSDRILVRLNPGKYRLDLDPAGFPIDWQPTQDAYGINVVAGSYTPVTIPFVPAYTLSGVITDTQGQPINGARIEAVANNSQQRSFSVTNGAGVYYLERLQQGSYSLLINDKPVDGINIQLDRTSESLKELNLQEFSDRGFRVTNQNVSVK